METLGISVLGGIIASAIFFLVMFVLRPRLLVSPYICLQSDATGQHGYSIKFVNAGLRNAMDIHVRLYYAETNMAGKGDYTHRTQILDSHVPFLPACDRDDAKHRYAFRISGKGNLKELWKDDGHLILLITACDSFSQVRRVIRYDYTSKAVLKFGEFGVGKDCDVH